MDFFVLLPITFILICVVMITKSYDNLLEENDAVIFISGNKAPIGAKDTIDGNTSTCLDIGGFYKGDVVSSWYVDFKDVQSVYEIIVYLDYRDPIDLSIFVSNSSLEEADYQCATEIMIEGYIKSFIVKMKCTTHGRLVILRMRARRKYTSLSICEVIVRGCRNGKFGRNCSRNCPDNCVGKSCDILEGKCLSGPSSDGLQRKDLLQRQENKYALQTEEDKTTEYALGALLPIIIIVNFILLVMYIRRVLQIRKDERHGKQSPVYLNISNENKKDNKPSDGEQLDKSNVTYEVLGVPSPETHYDALQ